MLQTGAIFGSEGPLIQGTWINPNTGDSFTVRDSFFEDNNYIITTTDGRYINYEQFQNYIQADEKSVNEIKNSLKNKPQDEPIPAEISNLIDNGDSNADTMIIPEDYDLIHGKKPVSLGNIHNTTSLNNGMFPKKETLDKNVMELPINMNSTIIKKALNNTETPKFNISLEWDKYPAKQIEMLYDIMNISEDEIVEWYLDNIQLADIVYTIKDSIKKKIMCMSDSKTEENTGKESLNKDDSTSSKAKTVTKKKSVKTAKSKK